MILRASFLSAAVCGLITFAAAAAPPQLLAAASTGAAAAAAAALAFLPQLLSSAGALAPEQQQRQQQLAAGSSSSSSSSSSAVGGYSLALEAAWAAAAVGATLPASGPAAAPWLPLVAASAAAAAAALAALNRALLAPRLAAVAAADGDEALVQVRIRLDSSPAPFDDSRETVKSGLRVRVGRRGSAAQSFDEESGGGEGGAAAAGVASVFGAVDARSRGALGPRALDAVSSVPGSQWLPLVPLIEAALPGALIGEVVSVPFLNGGLGVSDPGSLAAAAAAALASDPARRGAATSSSKQSDAAAAAAATASAGLSAVPLYRNRQLCWWQPLPDVVEKFGGRTPEAGEAFLYPVNASGAWLWTAVRAVGSEHVELDANLGTEGQRLVMEVEVCEIVRAGGRAAAATASSR